MRKLEITVLILMLTLPLAGPATSDGPQDCETVVKQCVAMFQAQGREAALKAINDPKGTFVKGDLYAFALNMDNKMMAHPHDKKILHLSMSNIVDANGERFFGKFKEVAEKQGSGWVEYTWAKPGEEGAKRKKSYIMKVPGEELYVGAGYYPK
jgi:signal transduction histidine kinase